ncbi:unnamed protein product [Rangifer tarandus platyrhynchus]|uniref:Uncharacterized protein n=1 Tax=Rangifer tarandus platyrhynchus TaxID=3082113 RepID=A0AC59ZRE3_RANTA
MGLNKMLSIERGRRGLRKSRRLWSTSFFFTFKLFILYWGVLAKLLQLCLTLCDPMDCNSSGSSVHGILQEESWSGLPRPPPGGLPDAGIDPTSLTSPASAGEFFTTCITGKPLYWVYSRLTMM